MELQELLAAKQLELLETKIAHERMMIQKLKEGNTRPDTTSLPDSVIENNVNNEVNRKKK